MVATVADPDPIALSVASFIPFGGYGAYATGPSKITRIKRAKVWSYSWW